MTNVLDPQAITRDEWLRLATTEVGRVVEPGLYHRRWEIETTFCELKVQQGMKGSLAGGRRQRLVLKWQGMCCCIS